MPSDYFVSSADDVSSTTFLVEFVSLRSLSLARCTVGLLGKIYVVINLRDESSAYDFHSAFIPDGVDDVIGAS